MEKRGSVGIKVFIVIALGIISFVLTLAIFPVIDFGEVVEDQTCHASVVQRGSLPSFGDVKDVVPLDCTTKKFCFGEDCEQEFSNDENVRHFEVESEIEIEKEISREVLACWNMMGEGKVSLFSEGIAGNYGFGDVYPSCVVCSRIAFDEEDLERKGIDLDNIDVERYMMEYAAPDSDESYFEAITGEEGGGVRVDDLGDIGEFRYVEENEEGEDEEKVISSGDFSGDGEGEEGKEIEQREPTNDYELAIVFSQISAPSHGGSAIMLGGTLAGSGFVASSVPGGSLALRATCGGPIRGVICGGIVATVFGYQQYNVYQNQEFTAGQCGDITSGDEARRGCSSVRAIPYDVNYLNEHCGVIESKES